MLRVACFFAFVLCAYSASAPFLTPCKSGDTACILSSAQKVIPMFAAGIPAMNIKPMDPIQIKLIKSEEGNLKLTFMDTVMKGLKDCSIEHIKSDLTKMKQALTIKCNLVLRGDYNLDGQLIILPVQGHGKYKIDIRDMVIKVSADLVTVTGPDSKPHWHINEWHHSFKVLTGTTFKLENLFNGNKALAQPVLEFANSNWKEVMQEIAPPIVQAIVEEVITAVESLYKAVPAEELFVA